MQLISLDLKKEAKQNKDIEYSLYITLKDKTIKKCVVDRFETVGEFKKKMREFLKQIKD
jgi:hypothetical protein